MRDLPLLQNLPNQAFADPRVYKGILNLLAELTYFADRGFYADWWNSVSWDQFAR